MRTICQSGCLLSLLPAPLVSLLFTSSLIIPCVLLASRMGNKQGISHQLHVQDAEDEWDHHDDSSIGCCQTPHSPTSLEHRLNT